MIKMKRDNVIAGIIALVFALAWYVVLFIASER